MKPPFKKSGKGSIKIKLTKDDKTVIADFLMQISSLTTTNQSLTWRLFPPLYSDPVEQAEHDLSDDGQDQRPLEISSSLALSSSVLIEKEVLTIQEATSLLRDLNRSRLVIAEIIGVKDDSFDPTQLPSDELRFISDVYNYLGWIVSELTEVMAS